MINALNTLIEENENLKEENAQLKENIHSMLFTDDVVQKRYDKALKENEKLKKQLEIAINTLNEYGIIPNWKNEYDLESEDFTPLYHHNKWKNEYGFELANKALKQIKELEK